MNLPAENTAPSAGPFVLLLGTACVKLPSVQHTAGVRAAAGPRGWGGEASVLLPPSATPVSGGRVAFSCSMNLLSVSTKIDTYMRTTSQIPTIPTFPFVLFLGKEKIELLFCLFVWKRRQIKASVWSALLSLGLRDVPSALFGIQKMTDCQGCPVWAGTTCRGQQCCLGLPFEQSQLDHSLTLTA